MAENESPENMPPAQRAQYYYEKGMLLKRSGSSEAALTEFRRAILADPAHENAQMEVGRLCKIHSGYDSVFLRTTFEAFRSAAHLNLFNQEAHDEYIMAGQKMGKLDELLREYENLAKFNPDNELLQRCKKNILTISMALIPDKINIASNQMSVTMKRLTLFASLGAMVVGLATMLAPVVFRQGPMGSAVKPMMTMGGFFLAAGLVGLILNSRMK